MIIQRWICLPLMAIFCLFTIFTPLVQGENPPRLKRAESFLGVHMDFHCNVNDKNVGQNTTPEMVNTLLDMIHPDYIQIDCKGHPGISSYPTKVGNHGDSFVGDPLTVWRKVTAERSVALYMHYSGVWDSAAAKKHPEWAVTDVNGNKSDRITSVFGSYADSLLIPQLIELANVYKVDGVWVDGECWATTPDFNSEVQKAFTKKTGIETVPTKPSDPNWFEWHEFHREAFRHYLRHYVAAVKKEAPDFQIASNWAFTDHMPEPVNVEVDFISGDYSHHDSINAARFSTRFMQTQGIGWDLMAWGFSTSTGKPGPWVPKTAVQLAREAACVLAQGGGFQAYFTQNRDGSIDLNKMKPMSEVATFCRERQEVCFQSVAVPQVAMVVPLEAHYRRVSQSGNSLFPWSLSWQRGMLQALLENHYSVEIYNDGPLASKLNSYPAVVVAQWEILDKTFIGQLTDYVQQGGGLVIIGEKTASLFDESFKQVTFTPCTIEKEGEVYNIGSLGKGKIAIIPKTISEGYLKEQTPTIRNLTGQAVSAVFPNPQVRVQGTPLVDVSLRRTVDGRLAVNLVNCSGPHQAAGILQSIDPIGPLSLSVALERKPTQVSLEPGNRPCSFEWKNGHLELTIDKVEIHDIVVIDDRSLPK